MSFSLVQEPAQSTSTNKKPLAVSCLVIGIGDEDQGDAAIGISLAQQLKKQYPKLKVAFVSGKSHKLVDHLDKAELIIVLDALQCDQLQPGTRRLANLTQGSEPLSAFRANQQLVSVCQALQLARMLGHRHTELWALGIAGYQFQSGNELSHRVTQEFTPAQDQILNLIKDKAPTVYKNITQSQIETTI